MTAPRLYHYTCADHGLAGIVRDGVVKPLWVQHPIYGVLAWFTDLATLEDPTDVGLNIDTLSCDRSAYRFEVVASGPTWWPLARVGLNVKEVAELESKGRPLHWWVSKVPVPIIGGPVATKEKGL